MRHRQRHVHQSLVEYVTNALAAGGWTAPTPPLGAPALTILDYEPQAAGEIPPEHSVCISIGTQGPARAFDLGGDLNEVKYVVFIDIYPSSEPIGIAIAEDVADSLVEQYVALKDYTASPAVDTGMALEMTRVMVEPIPGGQKLDNRAWRVVKATATLEYTP